MSFPFRASGRPSRTWPETALRLAPQSAFLQTNTTGLRLAIILLQRDSYVTATGGRYTMEFKTKAAIAE